MVPTSAVIPEMTGHKVFIMEKGRISSRSVEIGIRTDAQLQLVSGILPGDTLITSGIMQIKDGDLVSIQNIN
jgi:membrane fusion protein, multidrug efflux system